MPTRFRTLAFARVLSIAVLAGLGACSDARPTVTGNELRVDLLAVGSWDLDRARPDANSTLPFACEKAADPNSWPCISGAVADTIVSGVVQLNAQGIYSVAITHRIVLTGTAQLVTRIVDEGNLENESGGRIGTWGRSAMRIVLYPQSFTSPARSGDLSDTSFVHGMTSMSIGGARFVLR